MVMCTIPRDAYDPSKKDEKKKEELEEKENSKNDEPRRDEASPGMETQKSKGKELVKTNVPVYKLLIPFTQRLRKDVDHTQYGKFLQFLKQLHIDMPFVDALGEMLRYAKFLKEFLSNKIKLEESATVVLGAECSTILDLGTLKSTWICIQLVDRSTKYPHGIVEDVLVRVDKSIFSVEFVILDMDPDVEVPLILGKPFLATTRALIDVGEGKLVICVGDKSTSFNVSKLTKYPIEWDNKCYYIQGFLGLIERI
ncbi:PREDICTED: uncharacterized protein LOC109155203 [Ipomoea nil]|uniref:uncharacterized protein LOC109155203 n=1 Tax=Ipomoea nil TaxID=35883 RepID=UPI000901ACD4|nr:PREDICTED: uncharacterized protein LOC109155203 [Ipomoea nil]